MTAAITSPVELALGTVLHHAAGGASTATLLHLVATATQQAMGTDTAIAAVVLGNPDAGLSVHATARPPSSSPPGVDENLLRTGPAQTTTSSGVVSTIIDIRIPHPRWAPWSEQARTAGVVGIRCWPVRVADRPIGALVVLTTDPWSAPAGTTPRSGSNRSNAAGQALADVGSVALQLPTPPHRWNRALTHLQALVHNDSVVHQAIGMIAAAQHADIPTAAAALAAHADRHDADVSELARQIVTRTLLVTDISLP